MTGAWYHRGPCHRCALCGGTGCYVWVSDDQGPAEVHACAAGCDGPVYAAGCAVTP